MTPYESLPIERRLQGNPYPGRGVFAGMMPDGTVRIAYFIMGRSANSRNRVFVVRDGEVFTEPFDASKVEDPSLIIYAAIRQYGNQLIVTNGNQTDTIYEGFAAGKTVSKALESRFFEPDEPNFTPRISAAVCLDPVAPSYQISILKSLDEIGSDCVRYTFAYPMKPGLGHLIHTYVTDGNPLPTFCGEPERIAVAGGLDDFTRKLWDALDADNRISLYVRDVDLLSGEYEERLINRNR